jgi:hypothetical protein
MAYIFSSVPLTGWPVVKAPYAVVCTIHNYSDVSLACFSTNDIPCINTHLRHSSVCKCMSLIQHQVLGITLYFSSMLKCVAETYYLLFQLFSSHDYNYIEYI